MCNSFILQGDGCLSVHVHRHTTVGCLLSFADALVSHYIPSCG